MFPISRVSQFRFWLTLYPRRGQPHAPTSASSCSRNLRTKRTTNTRTMGSSGLWHREGRRDPPAPTPRRPRREGASRGRPEWPNHGRHHRSRQRARVFHSYLHRDYGIKHTSIEVAILPYAKLRGPFSAPGDSGSVVLDRIDRIVALLTGSGDTTDVTYGYWWLGEQKVFTGCYLLDVVA
jgi:hypothetical protein